MLLRLVLPLDSLNLFWLDIPRDKALIRKTVKSYVVGGKLMNFLNKSTKPILLVMSPSIHQ